MKLLHNYENGNCTVQLYDNGTKVRSWVGDGAPVWPESIDVKVTDFCDANCKFCHEKSTVNGLPGDFLTGTNLFKDMPAGTELAIGGGNPLSWRSFYRFTDWMSKKGIICNVTVNSVHLRSHGHVVLNQAAESKIYGIGISYNRYFVKEGIQFIEALKKANEKHNNVVFHVIMGVNTVDEILALVERVNNAKILILGYKEYGRGEKFHSNAIEQNKYEWFTRLHEFFGKKGLVLSFDNLAIKQLKLQRFFKKADWDTFYMGDDGKYTMYVDLVKKEYAKSSTSKVRYKIQDTDTTQSIFQIIRNETA